MQAGVWIDLNEAWIYLFDSDKIRKIVSKVEPYHKATGGSRRGVMHGLSGQINDKALKRKHEQQKKVFFDNVQRVIKSANDIVILGPGQTKRELGKVIENQSHSAHTSISYKNCEPMTENQFKKIVSDFIVKSQRRIPL